MKDVIAVVGMVLVVSPLVALAVGMTQGLADRVGVEGADSSTGPSTGSPVPAALAQAGTKVEAEGKIGARNSRKRKRRKRRY